MDDAEVIFDGSARIASRVISKVTFELDDPKSDPGFSVAVFGTVVFVILPAVQSEAPVTTHKQNNQGRHVSKTINHDRVIITKRLGTIPIFFAQLNFDY